MDFTEATANREDCLRKHKPPPPSPSSFWRIMTIAFVLLIIAITVYNVWLSIYEYTPAPDEGKLSPFSNHLI